MAIPYWDVGKDSFGSTFEFGEGPTYADNPWDTCFLGTPSSGQIQIPGLVQVVCQPSREVDKKKRHGGDGAKITVYGYLPSEVTLTVKIWTGAQWAAWQNVAAILWPRAGKPPADPFDIKHPETALWGISQIVITSPSSSKPGDVPQQRVWTIKCVEQFRPTKKSTVKTMKGSVDLHPVYQDNEAANEAGQPPSKTSTGPKGAPAKKSHGEVS